MERPPIEPDRSASEPTPEAVERAAEWLAHLESGDANNADIAEFEIWRAAHPTHAVAIERLGGLGAKLYDRSEVERETLRRLFLRPRRRAGGVFLGLVALIGASWLTSRHPAIQVYFADERTAAGETRDVPLNDGSRIVLASNSATDLDQRSDRRTVRLLRGELLAQVVEGRAVPFTVETMDGTAEALGTAFTVRKDAGATVVAVIASRVRACSPANEQRHCMTLGPGERARLADGGVARLSNVAPVDAAAWTEGWLPVDNRPLVEVLDELNRWRQTPIRFDRQTLADLRVSGIFPLRDTDRAAVNLARSLPITIDRGDPASTVIRRRKK